MMTSASATAMEKFAVGTLGLPYFKNIPPRNVEHLKIIEQGFSKLVNMYSHHQYIFGDVITYADFLISAYLVGLTRCMTEEESTLFQTWDDGKWAGILETFRGAGYLLEDVGELYKPSVLQQK
jgi:hypothetical protein